MASIIPRNLLLSIKPKAHVNAVWFTFFSLVTVTILFRFYGRRFVMKAWGLDDWVALFAYLALIGFVVVEHIRIARYYEAIDFMASPQPLPEIIAGTIERFEAGWAFQIAIVALGNWSIGPAKVSILCFFLRIVSRDLHRYILYTFAAVIMLWTVVVTVLPFFQRRPFDYLKHPITYAGPRKQPIDDDALLQAGIAVQLVFDGILMLLPIPVIFSLHVQRRVKIGLYSVYAIGFLSLATTIVRLVKTVNYASVTKTRTNQVIDPVVLEYPELSIWLAVETCTVFICANMPAIIASWKRNWRMTAANKTATNIHESKFSNLLSKWSRGHSSAKVDSNGKNSNLGRLSMELLPPDPVLTTLEEREVKEKYHFDDKPQNYGQQDLEGGR